MSSSNSNVSAQGCPSGYPNLCGAYCWSNCQSGSTFNCYNGNAYCCPSSYPSYCGRSGTCAIDQTQCNNLVYCNGQWWGCTPTDSKPNCVNNQVYCCPSDKPYYWGGSCHKCQESSPNECGGSCWGQCANSGVFVCKSDGQGACCPSGYPNYCGANNLCWSQSWMCGKSISCGGSWQVCGSSTDIASCDNSQLKCCPSDKPYYWSGQCQSCPQDKPNKCGTACYSGSECGSGKATICDKYDRVMCCPSDFPSYCSRTDSCWKNSDECSNAQQCGSEGWTVCRDPAFPSWNCKPDGHSACCPSDKPYYVDGQCRTCPADKPKQCGTACYSGSECGADSTICDKNNNVMCCPADWPYYCSRTDSCWKNSDQCNNAQQCGSEGWTACIDTKFPYWNCRSDGVSRCCPSGYPYLWNSDWLCHASPEQQVNCPVPDGSSAQCDCNSNADCPASKPYCEENYPSPISDGYDGCLASEPEYCGNGNCNANKGEDYNSCPQDCGGLAPKGTISVDVVYSSVANVNKPISGAYVYLDGALQGTTDSTGKVSFQAGYGQRVVKVNCPDSTFCDSRLVNVDGTEYSSVRCSCNPSGDSDGDGYSDEDEKLLGTDPKDASRNFDTTFGSDSVDLLACLPTPVTLLIIWKETIKKGGNIIQANSLVLNALNISSVTSASVEEHPYVVASAIAMADLQAEIVTSTNVTLEEAVKRAEYVDGIYTRNELLLIATDRETGTTAIIIIGAGCLGAFSGAIYGIGQGIVDDVKGIVDGIWFVITHVTEITKIGSAAKDLVTEVVELLKSPGEAVWTLFRSVLDKGKGINLFREDRFNNKEAYRRFQTGFVYGFVTGYVTEQVALGAFVFTKVAKAFKLGKLFGSAGKAAKLAEKLAIIRNSEEFGAELAEKLGKLKYVKQSIENWADNELKGLARIIKHNEEWAKGLSEAEAKLAAKRIDNLVSVRSVADSDVAELLKTSIGRKTFVAADATDELLTKQAKIANTWGAKRLDEVASRFDGFWWWQKDGWKKVNKFLNEVPESSIGITTKPEAVMNVIGDNDFEKIVDSLKNLKKADGGRIPGVDRSVKKVLDNPQEYRNEADNLVKASEMKSAGKTIDELESPLHDPISGKDFDADIKYKDSSGATKYVEHKRRKWPSAFNSNVFNGLKDQLNRYKGALGGTLDGARLSSRYPIPNWLKQELEKEFGKNSVEKLLGVE